MAGAARWVLSVGASPALVGVFGSGSGPKLGSDARAAPRSLGPASGPTDPATVPRVSPAIVTEVGSAGPKLAATAAGVPISGTGRSRSPPTTVAPRAPGTAAS